MAEYTAFPLLQKLEATLTEHLPHCSGILEIPSNNFELYYGKKDARFINLLKASKSDDHGALDALAQACKPAKFGRGGETVLDETYRKAGKMDANRFVTRFDVEATGLLNAVRLGLLSKNDEKRAVRAELYKLNVYGEGAFFKPHKDTPRSQSMFGSLVVIFPTPHEGGALVLRHEDEEFTFDAAALLSERSSSIAYVAFFSDVEHEVLPVLSGHRVTLTYNLFFGKRRNTTSPDDLEVLQPSHARMPAVKDALSALLDDPTFMPQGGTLGFGLRHHYPFPQGWTDDMRDPLESLEEWLKGSDAALFQACAELGVSPDLRLVSKGLEGEIMVHCMVDLGIQVEDAESRLLEDGDGVVLRSFAFAPGEADEPWHDLRLGEREIWHREFRWATKQTVHWLTRSGEGPAAPYAAYGNKAAVGWLYMRVGLLVTIGPHGRRTEKPEVEEDVEEEGSEDGMEMA